jgi:phosphatidylglycerophosphate synthase
MAESAEPAGRRPLKSREVPFFRQLAAKLARAGVTPNAISFASMAAGMAAGCAFAATAHLHGWPVRVAFLAAAACIQFRLICNLLDGLVAVEHQRRSPTGDIWNEVPDRVSDIGTIVGAGCALGGWPLLGFVAALLAVLTAYVRALGASLGAGQIFAGLGGKPQRMAVLTAATVVAAAFPALPVLRVALAVICCTAAQTVILRLGLLRAHLLSK